MTRDASFKKAVRRHADQTGQRYTAALTGLQGLSARMEHEPQPERLLAHLSEKYGIDPAGATRLSVHKTYVFRIDRRDGPPWVARAFPPARPLGGVQGDAAILAFLERAGYPAERPATPEPVSELEGSAVLVTRFVDGTPLPDGTAKFAMMGDLLGRLHALPADESAARPGGASGEDPSREGTPRQDLLAALSFLDAVDSKVAAADRDRFEQLRDQVRAADDGDGLPEALLHGNLLHAPDHALVTSQGPVAINWKAAGRGPRLADLAYLIWGTGSWQPRRPDLTRIGAVVTAYRRHAELTAGELDRLEGVMYIRTLYLACFGYRRAVTAGMPFNEWGGSSSRPATSAPPPPRSATPSPGRRPGERAGRDPRRHRRAGQRAVPGAAAGHDAEVVVLTSGTPAQRRCAVSNRYPARHRYSRPEAGPALSRAHAARQRLRASAALTRPSQ